MCVCVCGLNPKTCLYRARFEKMRVNPRTHTNTHTHTHTHIHVCISSFISIYILYVYTVWVTVEHGGRLVGAGEAVRLSEERKREGHRPAGVAKGQFDLMEVVVRGHLL